MKKTESIFTLRVEKCVQIVHRIALHALIVGWYILTTLMMQEMDFVKNAPQIIN